MHCILNFWPPNSDPKPKALPIRRITRYSCYIRVYNTFVFGYFMSPRLLPSFSIATLVHHPSLMFLCPQAIISRKNLNCHKLLPHISPRRLLPVEKALSYLGHNATNQAPDESILENHNTTASLLAVCASSHSGTMII